MGKKVAIVQSNYIPWKGYFDLINSVDEFILYDDMQYTRRDWRNRNQIKTASGLMWLTIPVQVKGKYYQKIRETQISDPTWAQEHWRSILTNVQCIPRYSAGRVVAAMETNFHLARRRTISSSCKVKERLRERLY
ncbi:MAG: WbqC family protein [Leptolyngbyaceae cyanobacterium bins.349]|nr:WbqC family protein [Leptolyngbyaceae cyanobacterium bins.349]